jgi:hypothetical protein
VWQGSGPGLLPHSFVAYLLLLFGFSKERDLAMRQNDHLYYRILLVLWIVCLLAFLFHSVLPLLLGYAM